MGYIYKIYNDVNDHLYIGQTSQPISDRWEGHKSSARNSTLPSFNDTVHIAMRKYGIEKFHIVEIEKCDNEFFKVYGPLLATNIGLIITIVSIMVIMKLAEVRDVENMTIKKLLKHISKLII